MPQSGWIAAILPLLAFSMALGGQAPSDWTGLRRFFRQQVSDAGIVGASLVIVRAGKVELEDYVGHQDEKARRPVDRDTIYQRKPERLPLAPLRAPPVTRGLCRRVQHRRLVFVAQPAADHPRRGRRREGSGARDSRREMMGKSGRPGRSYVRNGRPRSRRRPCGHNVRRR